MTKIDVFVKKVIEVPDSVTIRGTECKVEYYDDSDYGEDGDERYFYYMFYDEETRDMWEIRIYEQSLNDEVFLAAVVDNDIKESCYTVADSSPVSIAVRSLAKFLDEYGE